MTVVYHIDDSGRDDQPIFVLAGVAAAAGQISAFEDDWRSVLARPPSIATFKMKDAHGGRGEFKGWARQERNIKVLELAKTIERHAQALLSVAILHEDFDAVFRGQIMDSMDHPYELLFHLILAEGFKQQRALGTDETASFIFDRQQGSERGLARLFDTFDKMLDPIMRSFLAERPAHADDRDKVVLQAADLIAWHVRRAAAEGRALADFSAASLVLANLPGSHVLLDLPQLRFFADTMRRTAAGLNTLLPHDQNRVIAAFPAMASLANAQVMEAAVPFTSAELISLPAIGTARFLLVRSCDTLHRPHLHRRRGNACLGAATAG